MTLGSNFSFSPSAEGATYTSQGYRPWEMVQPAMQFAFRNIAHITVIRYGESLYKLYAVNNQ
ncbi:MAG: hypothetical protein GX639_17440 [Fibrobacter sp.]|nr:hypothetical protein [Fibrobacter sp.]